VLCLALVKQGKLIGVLYLENNLAPSVFTSKRLEMLKLLASQAAISLDHAQLYAGLRRSEAFLAQGQKIGHTGSWGWHVSTGEVYWSKEHFRIFEFDPETDKPSYACSWREFIRRIAPLCARSWYQRRRPLTARLAWQIARRQRRTAVECQIAPGHFTCIQASDGSAFW
jgi:hypothetical protein